MNEQDIEMHIQQRVRAMRNGDVMAAEIIAQTLGAEGIIIEDGPDGTTWRRIGYRAT